MSARTHVRTHSPAWRRARVTLAAVAVLALPAALAACGSSSSGSTTARSTNSAATAKASGSRSSRFASLRSCLQKEGITLPNKSTGGAGQPGATGQPGAGAPAGGGGGLKLPAGVSRAKFEEAIKKCGGGFAAGARGAFDSSAAKATLTKYAACMRENGVKLPTPNTSGKGPVFDTKGIDTSSATFKAAQTKCQSDLKGAFGAGRSQGGTPPAGGEGTPPAGGYGPPAGGYGPPAGSPSEAG